LSAAAVNLEALLPLVDRPLRSGLDCAVEQIDQTISSLRIARGAASQAMPTDRE
jgi:hypothetical protein